MTSISQGMNKQRYTHSRTKEHFEGHDNPLDFSVIKCKQLSDMISDSTLPIPSRKYPSVKFWCNSKENVRNDPKAIKTLFLFPISLPTLQPKHAAADRMQKHTREAGYLQEASRSSDLQKYKTMPPSH